MLIQQTLQTNFHRFMNFLGFAKAFFIRRNPFVTMGKEFAKYLKDFLLIRKKLKIAQYKVAYHSTQFRKMESLIAENNEHAFLRGQKINQVR